MGLDMYLHGSVYASKNDWQAFDRLPYNEQNLANIPTTPEFDAIVKAADIADFIDREGVGLSVEFIAGYWRKSNQIHAWFVNNCGGGERDHSLYVSREDLEALRDTCKQVIANPSLAHELLPPMMGFFFGSYEVDEWYMADLEHTVAIVDRCMAMPDRISFSYDSSW